MSYSITLLTSSYPPENGAAAKRLKSYAQYFQKLGWQVNVVTPAPSYPQNEIYDGYGKKIVDRRCEDGVQVYRIRPWIVDRANLFKRFFSEFYISFLITLVAIRLKSTFLLATVPYISMGLLGYLLSKIKKTQFILEVRDLIWRYGSAAEKRTFGLETVLEKIFFHISRNSDYLVTTTQGQLDYFIKGHSVPTKKRVVPNGVSINLIDKIDSANKCSSIQKTKKISVLYAGIIGFPQGLNLLIEAAKKVKNVDFVIAGDGVEKARLEKKVKKEGLNNVNFTGYLSQDRLLDLYMKCDILYASLIDDPVFKLTQPSKIWEYMCVAKPIIYCGNGEANKVIEDSNCGIAVEAEDLDGVVEAISTLSNDAQLRKEMGNNGRLYIEENYQRDKILDQFSKYLKNGAK